MMRKLISNGEISSFICVHIYVHLFGLGLCSVHMCIVIEQFLEDLAEAVNLVRASSLLVAIPFLTFSLKCQLFIAFSGKRESS